MSGLGDAFRYVTSRRLNNFKLARATSRGDNERVRALIAAGANVHLGADLLLFRAVRGYCRRHWAGSAAERREDTLRALLEAGIDVHARNDRALRIAVSLRRMDAVKMLLEAGADIHSLSRLEHRCLERLHQEGELARAIVRDTPRQPLSTQTPHV